MTNAALAMLHGKYNLFSEIRFGMKMGLKVARRNLRPLIGPFFVIFSKTPR